jgi:hypothetical protein
MKQDYLMVNKTNSTFPLWFALIVYWLLTCILLIASLITTNGHFGYSLDDTYIHMAIAKHFVNDGSWGVGLNGYSSSTSSPLWTLLIAMTYNIFGINPWSPFILSLLFGSLVIYYCYKLLRNNTNSTRLFLILVVILLFVPLPIMALTGMEHGLQCFLVLLLIYFGASYVSKSHFDFYSYVILIALANLTIITRYESILLVFSITLLLFLKKRFLEGFFFAPISLFLVTIYGFISLANGWYFLPNSVLLKGNTPSLTLEGMGAFLLRVIINLYYVPHVIVLLIACLILYLRLKDQLQEKEKTLLILSALTTFAHLLFAGVDWFFRYEAYIVLILSVILIDMFNKYMFPQIDQIKKGGIHNYGRGIFVVFLFLIPLAGRTGSAFNQYPKAVKNIYEQQYQMGLFLQKYYQGKCIAANDIGAMNYLANICTIDLYGLANMDVARYKISNSYTKDKISQIISDNKVQVIIIYNSWFNGKIPNNWVEVGKWKISNNVVASSDEVSFYAPNDSLKQSLMNHLIEFSHILPSSVTQLGMYVLP